VRSSSDISALRVGRPRRRVVIIVAIVIVVVLLFSLRSLAGLYTDSLWFSSIGPHEHGVWATNLETKLGLFLTFGLVFFLALWANLLLCNRLAPSELYLDAPEDELVRRYRSAVRPYAGRLYALLAVVVALIAASTSVGHWMQYLEFMNSKNFGIKDPLFGNDLSFYIFRLPFLTFIVDWFLASVFAILVLSVVFHYLNGGIRAARVSPRVSPAVKVHLSVLLAILAILKAAGYLIARWHMVTSTSNGVVEGAGYTDTHARLPALMVLFWLCLAAAAILLWNIRQRGWTLPAIAVGLWAFVAFVIGFVYPTVLQAVKVTPAQSSLEKPYIARNIVATRAAYGLDHVSYTQWTPSSNKPLLTQAGVPATLTDIREWDPTSSISQSTFQLLEAQGNYYSFSQLGEDRYNVNGQVTPVLVGVRELNSAGLPSQTWVNEHLEYTHGIGVEMIPSNQDAPSTGGNQPVFDVSNIPPSTTAGSGFPDVTQPDIYFGLEQSGYVVVGTKQPEFNYDVGGTDHFTSYKGSGGVAMGGVFRRFMFAVRFADPNLFFSNLIEPTSKIMFVRNVVQIAQRAAPFLSIDDHPYAVVVDGQVNWVLDGYTTTDQYPYSQNASTQLVPSDNGLPSSYNYVRNSVKIVVNAYTGKVHLYASPAVTGANGTITDPILRVWASVYPGLIQPYSSMNTELQAHMRYPEDLFSIQAAIYGRYHITNTSEFYNNGSGWSLSPTDGAGAPNQTLKVSAQYDKQGYIVSETAARMDPLYQVYTLPGQSTPQFTLSDAYVTASANGSGAVSSSTTSVYNLTAFMVALSDPNDYGDLYVYRPPPGTTIGPVQADAKMNADQAASSKITLLNREGSKVLLGNVLMVPLDGSMLYARPMYVTSQSTSFPLLDYMIVVYKDKTGFSSSLAGALAQVLGTPSPTPPTKKGTTAAELYADSQNEYQLAQTALENGQLGLYQSEFKKAYTEAIEAYQLQSGTKSSTTPPSSKKTAS
jgi:uncharacterized protein